MLSKNRPFRPIDVASLTRVEASTDQYLELSSRSNDTPARSWCCAVVECHPRSGKNRLVIQEIRIPAAIVPTAGTTVIVVLADQADTQIRTEYGIQGVFESIAVDRTFLPF